MSEWTLTRLGDVTKQMHDMVKVAEGETYPLLGVKWYAEGPFLRETVTAETSKATRFFRVQAGQFIYNRMFGWKGSFGLVRADLDGSYVSKEFPLFECDRSRMLPEFLILHFRQPHIWDEIERVSTGTTASRNRWKESQFNDYRIALPSVVDQYRIVDIIAAVDTQIKAIVEEAAKAAHVLDVSLAASFAEAAPAQARIVDLCSHVVGGAWGSPEGEGEVDRLALGPRIYAPGTSGFVTDGSPRRSFSAKQAESRTVKEGDIILERSGGSPEQPVGRVVAAGPGLDPCVPTDFQRLLRVDSKRVLPRYLFWRLRYDWSTGLTRNYSRRTTGITNLSVKDYIARTIGIPSAPDQHALVATADALDMHVTATRQKLVALRAFGSSLLTALLRQEIETSESYEAMLSEAVS